MPKKNRPPIKYRPRGLHLPTGRDSFITTVWYDTSKEAKDAVKMFGADKRHTNIRIIEKRKWSKTKSW